MEGAASAPEGKVEEALAADGLTGEDDEVKSSLLGCKNKRN